MSDTTHLIPVQRNAEGEATVNARDLHAFLEVGKMFAHWIQDRIKHFEFVENQDFIILAEIGKIQKAGASQKKTTT